jgi:hypothetical protein
MRLVNSEEGERNALQPADGILPGQPLRREVEQPVFAGACSAHHLRLLIIRCGAVEYGGRNAHLRQLRRLVLHERDQWRDHDRGVSQHQRR